MCWFLKTLLSSSGQRTGLSIPCSCPVSPPGSGSLLSSSVACVSESVLGVCLTPGWGLQRELPAGTSPSLLCSALHRGASQPCHGFASFKVCFAVVLFFFNVLLINKFSSEQRQLVTQWWEPKPTLAGVTVLLATTHLLQPLLFPADGTVRPLCSHPRWYQRTYSGERYQRVQAHPQACAGAFAAQQQQHRGWAALGICPLSMGARAEVVP